MRSLGLVLPLLLGCEFSCASVLAEDRRPPWAEKATFKRDGVDYFVGVSTFTKTIEEGRAKALEGARKEAAALLGGSPRLETQMIFEEPVKGGYRVFRLTRADDPQIAGECPKKHLLHLARCIAEHPEVLGDGPESNLDELDDFGNGPFGRWCQGHLNMAIALGCVSIH